MKIKKPNFEETLMILNDVKNYVNAMIIYIDDNIEIEKAKDELDEIMMHLRCSYECFKLISDALINYETLCLCHNAMEVDCSE